MEHVITSACIGVKDGACTQVCPVECIHDAGDQYVIDPEVCVWCGACVAACPVGAIYALGDVPEAERGSIERNRAFFV